MFREVRQFGPGYKLENGRKGLTPAPDFSPLLMLLLLVVGINT